MLILMQFLGFGAKTKGGGLTLKGKIAEAAHFVIQSCLVVPSIWQSFIQIGEMACITPAWSSGKLGLKPKVEANTSFLVRHPFSDVNTVKTVGSHLNSIIYRIPKCDVTKQ